jgi:5-formyltetrahydrofolate cyclo-ligase
MPHTLDSRAALRKTLRARRRAVGPNERRDLAEAVARNVRTQHWLQAGRRIGLYLPLPEELDTRPLLGEALRRGCVLAFPRVVDKRAGRMRFFLSQGSTRRGAFGILEPTGSRAINALSLDIVFVPLVGFDSQGHRLGMGKGFYDRHFAHRLRLNFWRRPLLIGLAYDCQRAPSIAADSHDVPLDAIVTESTVLHFSGRGPQ